MEAKVAGHLYILDGNVLREPNAIIRKKEVVACEMHACGIDHEDGRFAMALPNLKSGFLICRKVNMVSAAFAQPIGLNG